VGEGVDECGTRDDGGEVGLGSPLGVLLGVAPGVGEKGVGDLKGLGRAVSVAETASAMAVAALLSGSAVLDGREHAADNNSKTHHPTRRERKVLRFTFEVSRVDVQHIPQHGRG
jgi:hypothetical protein